MRKGIIQHRADHDYLQDTGLIMIFASFEFVLLLLPTFFSCYSVTPERWRNITISPAGLAWLAANLTTMLILVLGWVVFRAYDLAEATAVYTGMPGLSGFGLSDALAWQMTPDRWLVLPLAGAAVYLPLLRGAPAERVTFRGGQVRHAIDTGLCALTPTAGFALGVVLLYSRDGVPSLHFQF